jgi:multiple sugar transport system substrate-binding protein
MVSAGETPDVVEMPDRWLALYANNGQLENLEPYLGKWDQTAGLNARALEFARFVDNTAYMLPYGFYLRAMFYNKKLFEQAGVAGPPKTLDEFRAAAEKVSAIPANTAIACAAGRAG